MVILPLGGPIVGAALASPRARTRGAGDARGRLRDVVVSGT
jgi:hypothetical protein